MECKGKSNRPYVIFHKRLVEGGDNANMTILHQGQTREDYSLALTREVNLDTQSPDISADVIIECIEHKTMAML